MRVQEDSIIVTMAKAIREEEVELEEAENGTPEQEAPKDDQLTLEVE
jgi:hypothetical protein